MELKTFRKDFQCNVVKKEKKLSICHGFYWTKRSVIFTANAEKCMQSQRMMFRVISGLNHPHPLLPQSQSIWIYLHSFVNHLYIDLKMVLLHYFSIQFPLLIILSHLFLFEQWKKWKIFTHCGEKLVEKKTILFSFAIHANHLNLLTGNQ